MPIYDYRCGNCGERVEVLVRSGGEEPRCPNCGGALLEKLFSTAYLMSGKSRPPGPTCCGRQERCEAPPCSTAETCWRD